MSCMDYWQSHETQVSAKPDAEVLQGTMHTAGLQYQYHGQEADDKWAASVANAMKELWRWVVSTCVNPVAFLSCDTIFGTLKNLYTIYIRNEYHYNMNIIESFK